MHGIIRRWQPNGSIWEYTTNQGKMHGISFHIGHQERFCRPHTLIQIYQNDKEGDWVLMDPLGGSSVSRDDKHHMLRDLETKELLILEEE